MNLKAFAQILFLMGASIVTASIALLALRLIFAKKIQAVLIPVNSPENSVVLSEKKVCLGRSSDCDVIVVDPGVSAKHCLIIYKSGDFYVKDLKSVNGTFVNGIPVSYTKIGDGDILQLGEKKFIFKIG